MIKITAFYILQIMIAYLLKHTASILIVIIFLVFYPSLSINDSEQHILQNIKDAKEYVRFGVTSGRYGKYDFASVAFEKAISMYPNYDIAHYGLGLTYLLQNNKEAALAEFEILMTLNRSLAEQLYYVIYPPGIELLLG